LEQKKNVPSPDVAISNVVPFTKILTPGRP